MQTIVQVFTKVNEGCSSVFKQHAIHLANERLMERVNPPDQAAAIGALESLDAELRKLRERYQWLAVIAVGLVLFFFAIGFALGKL